MQITSAQTALATRHDPRNLPTTAPQFAQFRRQTDTAYRGIAANDDVPASHHRVDVFC